VPGSAARRRPVATAEDFAAAVDGSRAFLKPAAAPIIERRPAMTLREHIRGIWPIIEPGTKFVDGWHIGAVSEHLEACSLGQIQDLILAFPPRSMKSITLAVGWPTWEWTWIPHIRQIFSSYAAELSVRDSLKCRNVIGSRWYQRRYGHVFQLQPDQNRKTRFENDRSGYRLSTSVGGSATGEGGDRIVVDDAHKVDEADSTLKREATVRWWRETMSTRRNDPKSAVRVISGQRVNEADLTGDILSRELGYVYLKLPEEYDGRKSVTVLGFSDPRTLVGELLWPAQRPRATVEKLKVELGPYAYSAQYQQEPTPAKGAIFEGGWFKWYTMPDIHILNDYELSPDLTIRAETVTVISPAFDEMIQSVDASFKGKPGQARGSRVGSPASKGSDFVVDQVWARRQADFYLLDEKRGQWELPATIDAVRALTEEYPKAEKKLVEDKANGPAIIQTLQHELGGFIEVDPKQLGGDLIARARAAAPFVAAGNIYLPHPKIAVWIADWVNELVKYPRTAFDDRVASAVQAILILRESVRSATWRKRASEKKGTSESAAVTKRKY
jgi:predicted phage terminase large subunit-like protein